MDHAYIKEHSILERYETGKLSAAEGALFEEHFVDCRECQDQLQSAQDFRQALQAARDQGEVSTEFKAVVQSSSFVWRRAFVAAAACVGLLLLTTGLLTRQTRRLNRELSLASDDAGNWRQRYEAQSQANTQLQEQLRHVGEPKVGLPVVASLFTLDMTRGSQSADSEPANRVVLSKSPQWVVLSLDLDGNGFETYRATLKGSSGQTVWRSESLVPTSSHNLNIALISSVFQQDDYSLTLEGLSRQGTYTAAGHYSFRVRK